MPIEQLVKHVCNYKQHVTQYGGLRPYGVAFVFAGWDRHHGFQVYQSDPSGNFSGWRATVLGQNNQAGKSILKTDFKENSSVADNLKLAVKILLKTMDSTTPSPERIELSQIIKGPDGSVVHVLLTDGEVKALIDSVQKELDAETAKAEASTGDI
jgi:20S proteasome subunit alpha 3